MEKYKDVYEDWKNSTDIDKFIDYDEYTDGKKYLENFYKEIEAVLELVPEGLFLSQSPELNPWEATFHWYSDGRMLEILIESGEECIKASREPDAFAGEFKFGDPFDGFYESKIEIENKERIKELFKWLLDE
jgi:hypothetical protein